MRTATYIRWKGAAGWEDPRGARYRAGRLCEPLLGLAWRRSASTAPCAPSRSSASPWPSPTPSGVSPSSRTGPRAPSRLAEVPHKQRRTCTQAAWHRKPHSNQGYQAPTVRARTGGGGSAPWHSNSSAICTSRPTLSGGPLLGGPLLGLHLGLRGIEVLQL